MSTIPNTTYIGIDRKDKLFEIKIVINYLLIIYLLGIRYSFITYIFTVYLLSTI